MKEGKINRDKLHKLDVKYFYGVPELGRNVMWKNFDADPSIFLNFYHKSKSGMKPLYVLRRYSTLTITIKTIVRETRTRTHARSSTRTHARVHASMRPSILHAFHLLRRYFTD